MFFKTYYLGCLAHASYLVGGDDGTAAVIDPRRDVEEYLADAAAEGLRITHVIETHLHADFVSGHLEMARRTGARITMGHAAGARFEHHAARDGDEITLGDVTLRILETPGHTPESITVLASGKGETVPRYAFTGDTLFIGDVGRPDLAGSRGMTSDQMARILYQSLRDKIVTLPDAVEVWPAHGAGSACGRALSDDRSSTIGKEKRTNPALRLVLHGDEEGFVRYATEGLAIAPTYFSFDAQKNRDGAASVEEVLASARRLEPAEVEAAAEEEVLVLDVRTPEEFGAGHVPGALNIGLEGKFAPWVGTMVGPETPFIVVASPKGEVEAITRLARIGYDRIVGWLEGGMDRWREQGGEVATVRQADPQEALASGGRLLDVRDCDEWEAGHIEGARHVPLRELSKRIDEVPEGELRVLCGSGYRSSVACSLLQRAGRRDVVNIAGGWEAVEPLLSKRL
jgi:hydroxyacylglutathione hydrolase